MRFIDYKQEFINSCYKLTSPPEVPRTTDYSKAL